MNTPIHVLILLPLLLLVSIGSSEKQQNDPAVTATAEAHDIGYHLDNPVTANTQWTPVTETFDGVEMVLVPVGCFRMGNDPDAYYWDEANRVWIQGVPDGGEQCFDQLFWIDKFEVTQAQFDQFGGVAAQNSQYAGEQRPRERITWFEARDFCALRDAQLPTEREWEYAARGPDGLLFPWGNQFIGNHIAYKSNSVRTAEVTSNPDGASWVGALDLSGNVWEWTRSLNHEYPYVADDGREADTEASTEVWRVLRGGSWNDNMAYVRAATRDRNTPNGENPTIGVRCVRPY